MYRPVPLSLVVGVGYAALYGHSAAGTAVSNEAKIVREAAERLSGSLERSFSLFGVASKAISQIWELVSECGQPDWDGYGASAISPVSAVLAEAFIRALPQGAPIPEFAPEPDGSISLDWQRSKHRSITMSAGTRGRIAYAWTDGSDLGRGVFRLEAGRVPPPVLSLIQEIMND